VRGVGSALLGLAMILVGLVALFALSWL